MPDQSLEIQAAKRFVTHAPPALGQSPAFRSLPAHTQAKILQDLNAIGKAFSEQPRDPYDLALDTPEDLWRRRAGIGSPPADQPADSTTPSVPGQVPAADPAAVPASGSAGPTRAATDTIAARAGALSDEIDFPAFVAGLVHGTFDAIVDATIRQMEAFADLVSSVAKDVDQFTHENVTTNHVRDWLGEQYPRDLKLAPGAGGGEPRLTVVSQVSGQDGSDGNSPAWLSDFGLDGQPLTDELVESDLIPAARKTVGESRLKLLASMVLLGMSRVNVKDGTISARVRFRAAAKDKAFVNYATTNDPGGGGHTWGDRGSAIYDQHQTMVSTVGVNVQADSELKVELFGEVTINFVSETLPLERFADQARLRLLQRNARVPSEAAAPSSPALPTAPAPTAPPAAAPAAAPPPAASATPAAPAAAPVAAPPAALVAPVAGSPAR